MRPSEGSEDQPVPLRARCALDQRRLGVQHDPATGGGDGRRAAEAQREIQGFAKQQDQIRLRQHFRKGAETRVVDATRALHRHHRDAERVPQRPEQHPALRGTEGGRGDDERPLRTGQFRPDHRRGFRRQRHRLRRETGGVRPDDAGGIEPRLQHIRRQAEMHRAGAAGTGDADGTRQVIRQRCGGPRCPGRLGHRRGEVGVAQFLEGAEAKLPPGRMAGEQHQRHLTRHGGAERGDGIGMALPAGHQGDSGLPGQAGKGIGHVHRGGFLPGVDQLDPAPEQSVEDRHDVVAGKGEDRARASPHQSLDQGIGPTNRFGHVVLPGFVPIPRLGWSCVLYKTC